MHSRSSSNDTRATWRPRNATEYSYGTHSVIRFSLPEFTQFRGTGCRYKRTTTKRHYRWIEYRIPGTLLPLIDSFMNIRFRHQNRMTHYHPRVAFLGECQLKRFVRVPVFTQVLVESFDFVGNPRLPANDSDFTFRIIRVPVCDRYSAGNTSTVLCVYCCKVCMYKIHLVYYNCTGKMWTTHIDTGTKGLVFFSGYSHIEKKKRTKRNHDFIFQNIFHFEFFQIVYICDV